MIRCAEVERELALGSWDGAPAELASHLENCPRCAAWAEQARNLDRIWHATRPTPPAPPAWDAAWARIEAELTQPARTGSDWARLIRRAALAVAASLLVAGSLLLWARPRLADAPATAAAGSNRPALSTPVARVEIPVGQTVLYSVDRDALRVVESNEAGPADGILGFHGADEFLAFYGLAEFLPDIVAAHNPGPRPLLEAEVAPQ